MNQSEFQAITCNLLKPQEQSRVQGALGFGFGFHWLKNWREICRPITKRSNRTRVTTFDDHFKTAPCVTYKSCFKAFQIQNEHLLPENPTGKNGSEIKKTNAILTSFAASPSGLPIWSIQVTVSNKVPKWKTHVLKPAFLLIRFVRPSPSLLHKFCNHEPTGSS